MEYTLSNQRSLITSKPNVHKLQQAKSFNQVSKLVYYPGNKQFLWLGVTFFAQIGLMLPVAAFSILFFGDNNFLLWIIICAVNLPTLVLNLAALQQRSLYRSYFLPG
jgi:hypothetical protein